MLGEHYRRCYTTEHGSGTTLCQKVISTGTLVVCCPWILLSWKGPSRNNHVIWWRPYFIESLLRRGKIRIYYKWGKRKTMVDALVISKTRIRELEWIIRGRPNSAVARDPVYRLRFYVKLRYDSPTETQQYSLDLYWTVSFEIRSVNFLLLDLHHFLPSSESSTKSFGISGDFDDPLRSNITTSQSSFYVFERVEALRAAVARMIE